MSTVSIEEIQSALQGVGIQASSSVVEKCKRFFTDSMFLLKILCVFKAKFSATNMRLLRMSSSPKWMPFG
jgi:hypothetical protein